MEERNNFNFKSMFVRVIVSMIVLAVAAFFTPFFSIEGIMPLLLAAILIGVIDYIIERLTGFDAKPFGRGIIGFIVSVIIIYVTGMLIQGVGVNLLGAIIAAVVIGIINAIIPGKSVLTW